MAARRAWVVTIELLDAAAYVAAANAGNDQNFKRVLTLLRPRMNAVEVIKFLRRFYSVFNLDVDEQLAALARTKHEDDAMVHVSNHGSDIGLFSQPIHFRAQKATIYRTEEREDGEYLDWKPDDYPLYQTDSNTHERIFIEQRTFVRRADKKANLDRQSIFN